jgi:hypothetical protein
MKLPLFVSVLCVTDGCNVGVDQVLDADAAVRVYVSICW